MDADLAFALQLQNQFDCEAAEEEERAEGRPKLADDEVGWARPKHRSLLKALPGDVAPRPGDSERRARPLSIVDSAWELIDPSPNVWALFSQYNEALFWGKLQGVEVKWSKRMTLCAGVCCYEGRGGLCSIKLSEPLLKLRPRKDLVETLLHEMIHALLFVTHNNRDREGHGTEFCKHMDRINKETGTKITIYHSFHDEVDVYRQHWWRCTGPCRSRPPYMGYVKRAMNRAPSPRDFWWDEHQRTCNGSYVKVREPEHKNKAAGKSGVSAEGEQTQAGGVKGRADKKSPAKDKNGTDIRTFIPFSGNGFLLGGGGDGGGSGRNNGRPHNAVQASSTTTAVKAPVTGRETMTSASQSAVSSFKVPPVFPTGSQPAMGSSSQGKNGYDRGRSMSNMDSWLLKTKESESRSTPDALILNRKSVSNPKAFSKGVPLKGKPKGDPEGVKVLAVYKGRESLRDGNGAPTAQNPSKLKRQHGGGFPSPRIQGSRNGNNALASDGKHAKTEQHTSRTPTLTEMFQKKHAGGSGGSGREPSSLGTHDSKMLMKKEAVPSARPAERQGESLAAGLLVACPICQQRLPESEINNHLDVCLQ